MSHLSILLSLICNLLGPQYQTCKHGGILRIQPQDWKLHYHDSPPWRSSTNPPRTLIMRIFYQGSLEKVGKSVRRLCRSSVVRRWSFSQKWSSIGTTVGPEPEESKVLPLFIEKQQIFDGSHIIRQDRGVCLFFGPFVVGVVRQLASFDMTVIHRNHITLLWSL